MKPLFVLMISFLISLIILKITQHKYNFLLSGRIAMACMLGFTAIGHFVFVKGMTMMIPEFIPYKTFLIYVTGILELLFAIGLISKNYSLVTGYIIILFFIFLLPANIYAAHYNIDYQKGTFDGPGLIYLWFRIPLQILFIVWTYLSTIKF